MSRTISSTVSSRSFHLAQSTSSQVNSQAGNPIRYLSISARRLAGPSNDSTPALSMTTEEYERVSERDMDRLHENLEILCEEFGQSDWEVEYSSGVMNLTIPPHGTYVINKQPPNQQIWISSPVSGPSRFDYITSKSTESEQTQEGQDGGWVHHRRSEVKLGALLDSELREILASYGDEGKEWTGTGL
ncbi:iron donor protein CyaY [Kwoniella sp. CBS 6097]